MISMLLLQTAIFFHLRLPDNYHYFVAFLQLAVVCCG